MAIAPLGALPTTALAPVTAPRAPQEAAPTEGTGFGNAFVKALDGLEAVQDHADGLALEAATGDLSDVHDYMIAATEAALATEYTVAVRNRAVEAFNEIMRMQV